MTGHFQLFRFYLTRAIFDPENYAFAIQEYLFPQKYSIDPTL